MNRTNILTSFRWVFLKLPIEISHNISINQLLNYLLICEIWKDSEFDTEESQFPNWFALGRILCI